MSIATIQFTPWDKYHYVELGGFNIHKNDYIVVNLEFGTDIGKVIGFEEKAQGEENIGQIERVATNEDLKNLKEINRDKEKAIGYCQSMIKRHGLEMKLVDCRYSFDDSRITFAFIADGRVDFRSLVKDLTRHFQKMIRLHQLGVRDEAQLKGDVGPCGRGLCCQGHLQELGSVTSELAEQQQITHRGSERLSGICGRLKCCLAYEKELYEDLAKDLPAIGTRVRTDHGRGKVIGWHTLKKSVDVLIDPEKQGDRPAVVEIEIGKDKK